MPEFGSCPRYFLTFNIISMNQKNIFTGISIVLIIQGIVFFVTKDSLAAQAMPSLSPDGQHAVGLVLEVISSLSVLVGFIAYATRESSQVLWAFTLGFLLLTCVTLKHMFVDNVNVPLFAVIIQGGITLLCAYLWMETRKVPALSV